MPEPAEDSVTPTTVRLSLDYAVGDPLSVALPESVQLEQAHQAMEFFGPLSAMVLTSLREVGIPSRTAETQDLWALIVRDCFPGTLADAGSDEPVMNVRTAMLAWQQVAQFAQLIEETVALLNAIGAWDQEGRPRNFRCHIGESFLRWQLPAGRSLASSLQEFANPALIWRLMRYPERRDIAPRFTSAKNARLIEKVGRQSCEAFAGWLHTLSQLATDDIQRTFVRWKHRLSATTPMAVPIWLPRQERESVDELEAILQRGFGVIDWRPGRESRPEIILWRASRFEFARYRVVANLAIGAITFLLDSTLRWALPELPAVPWIGVEDLSEREKLAIGSLDATLYRNAQAALWGVQTAAGEAHPTAAGITHV